MYTVCMLLASERMARKQIRTALTQWCTDGSLASCGCNVRQLQGFMAARAATEACAWIAWDTACQAQSFVVFRWFLG